MASQKHEEMVYRRTYPGSTLETTLAIPSTVKPNAPFLARVHFQQPVVRRSRTTSCLRLDKIRWMFMSRQDFQVNRLGPYSWKNKQAMVKGAFRPERRNSALDMSTNPCQTKLNFLVDMSKVLDAIRKEKWSLRAASSPEACQICPINLSLVIEFDTTEEVYDNQDYGFLGRRNSCRIGAAYNVTVTAPAGPGCCWLLSSEAEYLPPYCPDVNGGLPLYDSIRQ